jgi:protease I
MKRFVCLFLAACLAAGAAVSYAQDGKQKKALFVIAAKDFQEKEFSRPFSILTKKGVSVTVASTITPEAVGTDGSKARVDLNLLVQEVSAKDYDAVVFIGGPGAAQYLTDPIAHTLAQDAVKQKKLVGAICMAPLILAKAGVLKGRKATIFPTMADDLKAEGVVYSPSHVERDGKFITADGPDSAEAFGEELAKSF